MAGPLSGLKIVEMAGLGPGPFAAMMLADHGAEVIRVERAGMIGVPNDPLLRNRKSISLDLKRDESREVVRRLGRTSRWADRRLSAGRDGAAWAGAGGATQGQSAPGLWTRDGLGAVGAAGAGRRARHQLHRVEWPASRHRAEGAAGGADQLPRRLCGRRDDAGVRDGCGVAGGAAGREGAGNRRGDERWRRRWSGR